MKRIPTHYDFMTEVLSNHNGGNRKKFSDRKGGIRTYAY